MAATPGDPAIGVLAAAGAIVCFGSFGVPIKSRRVLEAKADPLVYQLYKSLACFGSSLAVLLFRNFAWTWWAVLGATMWVATGTMAIYAIQRAGLGLAQTTYSCLTVFTSYLWGVAAFGEAGSSTGLSLLGLSLIALGLGGLGAAVQAPPAQLQRVPSAESTNFFGQELSAGDEGGSMGLDTICEGEWEPDAQPAGALGSRKAGGGAEVNGGSLPDLQVRIEAQLHHRSISSGDLGAAEGRQHEEPPDCDPAGASPTYSPKGTVVHEAEGARVLGLGPKAPGELRIILRQNWNALHLRLAAAWGSPRGRGTLAAAAVGLLNGSFLVPFKLARRGDTAQGIEYVVPFALASLLVTLAACALYYGLLRRTPPALHARAVAGPALLTGLLWSAGNVCSIVAVQQLGLSVGFPLVQCQLVVSTAWAVLYYREVPPARRALSLFLLSTLAVVFGMALLAAYGS